MISTLFLLLAGTSVASGQSQAAIHNPLNAPEAIRALTTATRSKEFSHYLLPRGRQLDRRSIPDAEKQKAVSVIKQILKPYKTPRSASLQWSAITNDVSLNEHLVTQWTKNQANIIWSDVDEIVALMSVTFLDRRLPVEQPEVFLDMASDWIVDNFQMPNPMPADMELFQTVISEDSEHAISGFIAFPDDVNNEMVKSGLPANKRWIQSFSFAATRKTLVLLIHTNWITTESPHRPESQYRNGKRVSRFDGGN